MKTSTYHVSNLGAFAPTSIADSDGYVTYHDSPRYGAASSDQLEEWAESRNRAVRAAAITEQAERSLKAWRAE